MENIRISELPLADTLTGNELVPIVQEGQTKQATAQDIADLGGGVGNAPLQNNYSSNEVALKNPDGTPLLWTDGKPLYRKVFSGAFVNNHPNAWQMNIVESGVKIVRLDGYFISSNQRFQLPVVAPIYINSTTTFYAVTDLRVLITASNSEIIVDRYQLNSANGSKTLNTGSINLEIIYEYTKNAD